MAGVSVAAIPSGGWYQRPSSVAGKGLRGGMGGCLLKGWRSVLAAGAPVEAEGVVVVGLLGVPEVPLLILDHHLVLLGGDQGDGAEGPVGVGVVEDDLGELAVLVEDAQVAADAHEVGGP